MEIPDELQYLFVADVEETSDAYQIEVPKREVELGALSAGSTYKIAVLSSGPDERQAEEPTRSQTTETASEAPVAEGETRTVEIEDVGGSGRWVNAC